MRNEVLDALKRQDYQMTFTASDRIEEGLKYDGTPFYVFVSEDEKPDANLGSCTVQTAGHAFVYDMKYGHWHGDEPALYEDHEIREQLERLPGFVLAADYDNHAQWKVYAALHGLDEGLPYYWYSEAPKDIRKIKGGRIEIPARYDYNIMPGAAKPEQRVWCTLTYADLAALYPLAQTQGIRLPDEEVTRLPGKVIEEADSALYNRILNAVQKGIIENGEIIQPGRMVIALRLTPGIFEEHLG